MLVRIVSSKCTLIPNLATKEKCRLVRMCSVVFERSDLNPFVLVVIICGAADLELTTCHRPTMRIKEDDSCFT